MSLHFPPSSFSLQSLQLNILKCQYSVVYKILTLALDTGSQLLFKYFLWKRTGKHQVLCSQSFCFTSLQEKIDSNARQLAPKERLCRCPCPQMAQRGRADPSLLLLHHRELVLVVGRFRLWTTKSLRCSLPFLLPPTAAVQLVVTQRLTHEACE